MSYYVMIQSAARDKDVAVLDAPSDDSLGVDLWELFTGTAVADRFSAGAKVPFDTAYKGRKLVDLQTNPWGGFVVSARLRALLEREPRVEFLPVQLTDHKGKIASTEYSLANFLDPVDCLDRIKSVARVDAMDKTRVDRITKLVVDSKKVPPGRHAFRLMSRPRTVLLSTELANAIFKAKLTGIGCIPEAEYDSTGIVGV